MKKTLFATLIVAMSAFAAAQDAPPAEPAAPTEPAVEAPVATPEIPLVGSEGAIQGLAAQNIAPEDRFAQAQELAAQAEIAYPVPFYDRILYKAAIESAVLASRAEPDNREYAAYVAQLFTVTQWWINAYNAWSALSDLTDQEKQWASLSAAKLAYLALEQGDTAKAQEYIAKGREWQDSPSLQNLARRAGG